MTVPAEFFALPIGTRVVVRYRLSNAGPDGPHQTDALGALVEMSATFCRVRTRAGVVQIAFADIVAAKQVPQSPPRRLPHRPQR